MHAASLCPRVIPRRRFVQQFSEVGSSDNSLGDVMEGMKAVVYFPLDVPSALLGGAGSDDTELYRNVNAVRLLLLACCRIVMVTAGDERLSDGAEQRRGGFCVVRQSICQYHRQRVQGRSRIPRNPRLRL